MSRQLVYTGKTKDIYTTPGDGNLIILIYKDQATVFNSARKETIKGKDILNNQISSLIFTKLNEAGVATHFVKQSSEIEQLNKKVGVVPLEVALHNITAGSFSKRFGAEEGIRLDTPIAEFYYKNGDLDDPFINDEHVEFLGITSDEDIAYVRAETRRTNDLLKDWFSQVGLDLIDLKLEFGKDEDGKIILAGKFSPDNCHFWDTGSHHMDKDAFRHDLGSLTDVYEVVLEKLEGLN